MRLFILCWLSLLATVLIPNIATATASSTTDPTVTAITNLTSTVRNAFIRADNTAYVVDAGKTHFLSDLFDFYKYNKLRDEEKEAYFFYMIAPSQNYYIANYEIARQNQMFQLPFTYYDTSNAVSLGLEKNYLYTDKMYTYAEFLSRSFIDPTQVNVTIEPTDIRFLPRNGVTFQTSIPEYDGLLHTSSVQDFVFKHHYFYCPENYTDVCASVLNATSSNVFTTSGMATTSPNGDINAESLLAEASMQPVSANHTRARDFIQNISDPYPKSIVPFKPDPANPNEYIPDTSDILAIGKNIVDKSYRSLAQYVLNEIKNRRVLSSNPSVGTVETGSISPLEFFDNLANNRILLSNDWITSLNTTSSEGLLRELVIIQASSLMLDYQRFRQNEHIEALLAATVTQNQNLLEALNFGPTAKASQNALNAVTP